MTYGCILGRSSARNVLLSGAYRSQVYTGRIGLFSRPHRPVFQPHANGTYHCRKRVDFELQRRNFFSKPRKASKFIAMVQRYGMLVIVFHSGVWCITIAGAFLGLTFGFIDFHGALDFAIPDFMEDKRQQLLDFSHTIYGTMGLAYAITFVSGPPRLILTIIATPFLSSAILKLKNPTLLKLLNHNSTIESFVVNPFSFLKSLRKVSKS